MSTGKDPLVDRAAEEHVIGWAMRNPRLAAAKLSKVREELFWHESLRVMWRVIAQHIGDPGLTTVLGVVNRDGLSEVVGGLTEVRRIREVAPSWPVVEQSIAKLRELAETRALVAVGVRLASMRNEPPDDIASAKADAIAAIMGATGEEDGEWVTLDECYERLEERQRAAREERENGGQAMFRTGIPFLDEGMQFKRPPKLQLCAGRQVVIAGRPGSGKSALMRQIVAGIARRQDVTACVVAEMQRCVGVVPDGLWGPNSQDGYDRTMAFRRRYQVKGTHPPHVAPGSRHLRRAADEACRWLGYELLSDEEFDALSYIIDRESDGWTKRPNYTADDVPRYADRRYDLEERFSSPANRDVWEVFANDTRSGDYHSRSSCVGVGQGRGDNYEFYCPMGRAGIGNTVAEVAFTIAYCRGRYGSVLAARTFYDLPGCPPDKVSYYSAKALQPDLMCKPGEGY